jgi:hypothetical protein
MNKSKQEKLKKAGWEVGNTSDFLIDISGIIGCASCVACLELCSSEPCKTCIKIEKETGKKFTQFKNKLT